MNPARRESDGRINWAGVAAVLALLLMAYQNVSHRDAMVAKDEQHAAELRQKDAEIALRKGEKRGKRVTGNHGCSVVPDGHALFICTRCNTEWTRPVKKVA